MITFLLYKTQNENCNELILDQRLMPKAFQVILQKKTFNLFYLNLEIHIKIDKKKCFLNA